MKAIERTEDLDQFLGAARERTLTAMHQAQRANIQNDPDPEWPVHIQENERISHVVCCRPYMPPVPWRVCRQCWAHVHTIYDTIKRPIVTCRANQKEQECRTIYRR